MSKWNKKGPCKKGATFDECELAILRQAIDEAQKHHKEVINVEDPSIKKMINILESFLRSKKLICYGGTAINNILPREDQFYDLTSDIPDYDFFSTNALKDAKELANIYYAEGFTDVEAKSGVHHGTFKVFVNFVPIADITFLDKEIFDKLYSQVIKVDGIKYCPPNYLRMSMYLELSRPAGDVSRWEKVQKRLALLNKHYPFKAQGCDAINYSREMSGEYSDKSADIYAIIRDGFVNQGVVFFGGYAKELYSQYMPANIRNRITQNPDFDVLSDDPEKCLRIIKERLEDTGIRHVQIIAHNGIGEIIAAHYELRVGSDTVAFVYKPLACHSYNSVKKDGRTVNIASIDTMLSFYLAFLYADRPYYDVDRILCMSEYLFRVQQENRLSQKGLLRRFTIECYGKQATLGDMRIEKAEMFKKLKDKTSSKEYEEWFLKYNPGAKSKKGADVKKETRKNKRVHKKSRRLFGF